MNIVLFPSGRSGRSRHFDLAHPVTLTVAATGVLLLLGAAFALGLQLGTHSATVLAGGDADRWTRMLTDQKSQIADLKAKLQSHVDALAMRLGRLDAHVIRIDALGKRLTEMAHVDRKEFNFDAEPAIGGPDSEDTGTSPPLPELANQLSQLEQQVDLRDAQLAALENVFVQRNLSAAIQPEGKPVLSGFISSYYGEREDPFTGHEEFHKGLDFAGAEGAPVVAVAGGVVTFAGERAGYGTLVEISHGKGYVTRYAHNEKALVKVGQAVRRGETVALMGSTGHSTGPHVHFEVLRDGRQINPLRFVEH